MNEENLEARQQFLAERNEGVTFVTRRRSRSSSKSFVFSSIALGLLIAIIVSLTSQAFSGAFLVGGVMAALMAVVVIQRPELGAYLLIITVFTNLSDYVTERGLPSVNQPLIALTYLSVFVNYVLMRRGGIIEIPRISRIEGALLAYFLTIVISLFVSPNSDGVFYIIIDVAKDILAGVCLFLAFNDKEKWSKGGWILIILIANLALLGVVKMASGTEFTFGGLAQLSGLGQVGDNGELRYGGPIGEPNIWAQILVATMPLVLYRFSREKNSFVKINLLFAALMIMLAIIYTGSRGAFVALVITLPLIAIERKVRFQTAVSTVAIFMVLMLFMPKSYTERLSSLTLLFDNKNEYSLQSDSSFAGREEAMLTGLAMFRDKPLLGVGFGNYGINYSEYASILGLSTIPGGTRPGDLPKPHSLYVEIISETGLIGFLTFGAFFGGLLAGILKVYLRDRKKKNEQEWATWQIAFFFSILSFLISGIFLHGILWRFIWMLIGLAMAILSISENRSVSLTKPRKPSL